MFRKITAADEAVYTELLREFYHSPAVLHPIPEEYYHRAFEEAVKDSPYAEAYLFEQDGQIAGYGTLAKTFSTEAGGPVIWLEEVYIRQEFRGSGLGSRFSALSRKCTKGQPPGFAWRWSRTTKRPSGCIRGSATRLSPTGK